MSDWARDLSEETSNSSNRRKPKPAYHLISDGRSYDRDFIEENRRATQSVVDNHGSSYQYDGLRTLTAPNPRFNDVRRYHVEQPEQVQRNPYDVAPPSASSQGGNYSAYASNSDTGNTVSSISNSSFNKVKSGTAGGNVYHEPVTSTYNVINVTNIHPAPSFRQPPSNAPSADPPNFLPIYPVQNQSHSVSPPKPKSDQHAPVMRPSVSDPSYNQYGDARHQRPHQSQEVDNQYSYQSKSAYLYHEEQKPETTMSNYKERSHLSTSTLQTVLTDNYKTGSSHLSQGDNAGKRPHRDVSRPQRDSRSGDGDNLDGRRTVGENYQHRMNIEHRPIRASTLPAQTSSTSWIGRNEGDLAFDSPPNSYMNMLETKMKTSSSDSVQTIRPDNVSLNQQRSKTQGGGIDASQAQNYDSQWAATRSFESSPSSSYVNNSSSLPSTSPKGHLQDSQASPYAVSYGSSRETDVNLHGGHSHSSTPLERAPPLARGVSNPSQHNEGDFRHKFAPSRIQPQENIQSQHRPEGPSTSQSWICHPNSSLYGTNTHPSVSSDTSIQMNESQPNVGSAPARSVHLPSGQQYPNQLASGSWSGPSGPSPGTGFSSQGYPQPQMSGGRLSRYEQDLSQQLNQLSIINPPRGPLVPIPEARQSSNSTHTLHRHDISQTSLLTLPDKWTSIGNPSLRPLRQKKEEGRRKKKSHGTESFLSLYTASSIVDDDTTPLWSPCPKILGQDRQRRGIEVGDLGYMDDSGEFTTIFNIFYSHEVNTARGGKPPPYHHYQQLRATKEEVVKQVDIQKRYFYVSENIERHDRVPPGQFHFMVKRRSGRSGAIIVLPHGGTTSTLRSRFFQYPHVKQYFQEHAASWYQHINSRPDIPNLPNGSLIFVQGTHLARTWGIAAFLSKENISKSQEISFNPNRSNPYEYQWDWFTEMWKVKAGPSAEELSTLQTGQPPPKNQCIGIIASGLFLDDTTWDALFAGPTDRSPSKSTSSSRAYKPINRILSRVSSLSSIKVDRPSGRRYMDSYLENQGPRSGNDYDLLRMDI